MALHGNIGTIRQLRRGVESLPRMLAAAVAQDIAPLLTTDTHERYDAGTDVYGNPRPTSVAKGHEGEALSLVKSGATRQGLRFHADGTRVRVPLPTAWTKFLIGKYKILPIGVRGEIPFRWRVLIRDYSASHRFSELSQNAGLRLVK